MIQSPSPDYQASLRPLWLSVEISFRDRLSKWPLIRRSVTADSPKSCFIAWANDQIMIHLREAEVELAKGQCTAEVCRKLGSTEQTYYRWRKEYGSLRVDQVRRLKYERFPSTHK